MSDGHMTSVPSVSGSLEPPESPPPPPPPPAREYGNYRPETGWKPVSGTAMALLNVLGMFLISALPLAFLPVLAPDALEGGVDDFMKQLQSDRYYGLMLAGAFGAQIVASLLLLWMARYRRGTMVGTLALTPPVGGLSAYLWAIPAFVIFGMLLGYIFQVIAPDANKADMEIMMQLARSPWWWLMGLTAVLGAPIYEELVFRGFFFSTLAKSRLGFMAAALITSAVWASIHFYSRGGVIVIFFLGLALAAILYRTGSTRVTIACHAAYNGMAFLATLATPPPVP